MVKLPYIKLKPGMVVAEDIKVNNFLIVPKGTNLTKRHILKIGMFDVQTVPILDRSEKIILQFPKEMALYEDAQKTIRSFFDTVHLNQPLELDTLHHVAEEITSSVIENENAFLQLSELKNKDEYTFYHSINVCIYALIVGKHLQLSKDELLVLAASALMHDIGKCNIPDSILLKPGKLTDQEFAVMKTHTIEGANILKKQKSIDPTIIAVALEHHEKWDGRGYPTQKSGKECHLYSRIVGMVDTYDALTAERVYKPPMPQSEAAEYILGLAGYHYDPYLVKMFLNSVAMYPLGATVALTSGEIGIIEKIPPDVPWRPTVKVLYHQRRSKQSDPYSVNLLEEHTIFIEKIIKE